VPADGLASLADDVLPALIARLRASRLGELEVRTAGWRVRLRRDVDAERLRAGTGAGAELHGSGPDVDAGAARSPAVGYFSPAASLAVGQAVQAGDSLGSVDVLGIVQDVTAPIGGIIGRVLAESGQAVEYGQTLAHVDALDAGYEVMIEAAGAIAPVVD
jgi:biotin carboxyl carrier protein